MARLAWASRVLQRGRHQGPRLASDASSSASWHGDRRLRHPRRPGRGGDLGSVLTWPLPRCVPAPTPSCCLCTRAAWPPPGPRGAGRPSTCRQLDAAAWWPDRARPDPPAGPPPTRSPGSPRGCWALARRRQPHPAPPRAGAHRPADSWVDDEARAQVHRPADAARPGLAGLARPRGDLRPRKACRAPTRRSRHPGGLESVVVGGHQIKPAFRSSCSRREKGRRRVRTSRYRAASSLPQRPRELVEGVVSLAGSGR